MLGALNLETLKLTPVEGEKIDAESSPWLLKGHGRAHPDNRETHEFLDNAGDHLAKMLKPFRRRPECGIWLQPLARAPHPNPVERSRGIMHRHVTHSRFLAMFRQVTEAHFVFRNEDLPQEREAIMESFTDRLRVVTHDWFRLIG